MPRKQNSAAARAVATLRERIIDGVYGPGDRLPSATVIATEFDIDRGTASRVLAELRHAGLIITKPGSGSFVRTFEPILRSFPGRLLAWRDGQAIQDADTGKRPRAVAVTVNEVASGPSTAIAFGISPGDPLVRRSRRFTVEDRPVQLADSYYLPDMVRGTPIVYTDTGPGGVYARLAEIGREPVRFTERLRARMPLTGEATALDLPTGTPVLAIIRSAFDAADRCVEVTEMILDASAYELDYHASI